MVKVIIPENIKEEINIQIGKFNESHHCEYMPRYKKNFLYLDRDDDGTITHVCRLAYKGKISDWDFAIYKYSDEGYDDGEWFFPGSESLDGTVEGAMLAGLKAYPP